MPQRSLLLDGPVHEESRKLDIGASYFVSRPSLPTRVATVLNVRRNRLGEAEAYVSFAGDDKRLDHWVSLTQVGDFVPRGKGLREGPRGERGGEELMSPTTKRRKGGKVLTTPSRDSALLDPGSHSSSLNANHPTHEAHPRRDAAPGSPPSTPEREHAMMTRVRNFEDVRVGEYLIKTWYYSPYPLFMDDSSASPLPNGTHGAGIHGEGDRERGVKRRKVTATESPSIPNGVPNGHIGTSAAGGSMVAHADKEKEREKKGPRTVGEMFAMGVRPGGEGARGRLWVCDLCFKYMRTRAGWDRHSSSCEMLLPPGRRVYQRGSYTIWEVDGAIAPLYCQNLSLFGKLFIDHKSVFFHVENFLFYVLCDASTSRRDQAMAFFSKEKISYDDSNLACIVTFPPFQGRGFGKLLIEFSYYLTLHPSTRPLSLSPGSPERPLSDLGLKGYTAYWAGVTLRLLHRLLDDAPPIKESTTPLKVVKPVGTGPARELRRRSITGLGEVLGEMEEVNGVWIEKIGIPSHRGQYAIRLSLAELAKAAHIRADDLAMTLGELGFLERQRPVVELLRPRPHPRGYQGDGEGEDEDDAMSRGHNGIRPNGGGGKMEAGYGYDHGEWDGVELVITREMVESQRKKWRVGDKGVLDESCVLL